MNLFSTIEGALIDEYVYDLLIREGLERVEVPVDGKSAGDSETTFIFQSRDALTNPNKLLLIIHGSGIVRAGQWARRLIINDSIEKGEITIQSDGILCVVLDSVLSVP